MSGSISSGGPKWQPGTTGFRRLERKKVSDTSIQSSSSEGFEPELGTSQLAKLTSGPKPSKAKTLYGFFYRVLHFLGLSGNKVGADLLHAIHSDETLVDHYKMGVQMGPLKVLKPSKAMGFIVRSAERMRKKSPELFKSGVVDALREAKKWAKEVEVLKESMTVREESMEKKRAEWDKRRDEIQTDRAETHSKRTEANANRAILIKRIRERKSAKGNIDLKRLEQQIQRLDSEIKRHSGVLEKIEAQATELSHEDPDLKEKLEALNKSVQNQDLAGKKEVLEQLKSQLEEKQDELESQRDELKEIKDQLKQDKSDLKKILPDAHYEKLLKLYDKKLENLVEEKPWYIKNRKAAISSLSGKMAERVAELDVGEKVVFSYSDDLNDINWSLIQIEKGEEDSYTMKIIDNTADLAKFEVNISGKKKKERVAVYTGFKAKDLDKRFWKAVIVAQLPERIAEFEAKSKQDLSVGNLSLKDILRQKTTSSSITQATEPFALSEGYGRARETSTAMRTLKLFINVNTAKLESGKKGLGSERSRIALGLSALREFYSSSYYSMEDNRTQRELIEKAIKNLRRQANKAFSNGKINRADLLDLNHDLQEMDERLQKLREVDVAKNPLHKSLPSKQLTCRLGMPKTVPLSASTQGGKPPKNNGLSSVTALNSTELSTIFLTKEKGYLEGVQTEGIPAKLTEIRKRAMHLYKQERYEEMTALVAQVLEEIPFNIEANKDLLSKDELKDINPNLFELTHAVKRLDGQAWDNIHPHLVNGANFKFDDFCEKLRGLNEEEQKQYLEIREQILDEYPEFNFQLVKNLFWLSNNQMEAFDSTKDRLCKEEKNNLEWLLNELPNDFDVELAKTIHQLPKAVVSCLIDDQPSYKADDLESRLELSDDENALLHKIKAYDAEGDEDALEKMDNWIGQDLEWFETARGEAEWSALDDKQKSLLSEELSRFQQIMTEGTFKTSLSPKREILTLKSALIQDRLLRESEPDYALSIPKQLKNAIKDLRNRLDPEKTKESDYYQTPQWKALADELLGYADAYRLDKKGKLSDSELYDTLIARREGIGDKRSKDLVAQERDKIESEREVISDKSGRFLYLIGQNKDRVMGDVEERFKGANSHVRSLNNSIAGLTREQKQLKESIKNAKAWLEIRKKKPDEAKSPSQALRIKRDIAVYNNTISNGNERLEEIENTLKKKTSELSQAKVEQKEVLHERIKKLAQHQKETESLYKEKKALDKEKAKVAKKLTDVGALHRSLKDCADGLHTRLKKTVTFEKEDDTVFTPAKAVGLFGTKIELEIPTQLHAVRTAALLMDGETGFAKVDRAFLEKIDIPSVIEEQQLNDLGEFDLRRVRDKDGTFTSYIGKRRMDFNEEPKFKEMNYRWGWAWSRPLGTDSSEPAKSYALFDKKVTENGDMNEYTLLGTPASLFRLGAWCDEMDALDGKESFKQLLTSLNKKDASPTDLMSILGRYPELIDNESLRSLIEARLMHRGLLREHMEKNPLFFENIVHWIEDQTKGSSIEAAPARHAFYLRMGALFHDIVLDLEKDGLDVTDDQGQELEKLRKHLEETLEKDVSDPFKPYLGTLWVTHLQKYRSDQKLYGNDVLEIYQGIAAINCLPEDPQGNHRLMRSHILGLADQLESFVEEQAKDAQFREALLDSMAKGVFGKRGDGDWKGSWPRYENKDLVIDINKKIVFTKVKQKGKDTDFPEDALKWFAGGFLSKWGFPKTARLVAEDSKNIYSFNLKNISNIDFHFSDEFGDQHLYLDFERKEKTSAYEYIPSNSFLIDQGEGEDALQPPEEGGLTEMLSFAYKIWRRKDKKKNPLPSFLDQEGLTFWKNTGSSEDVLVMNKEGVLTCRIALDGKGKIKTYENLLVEKPETESLRSAIGVKHPVLQQISRFETPENIELYGEKKNLTRMRLPRFDIDFRFENGQWNCYGPEGSGMNGKFFLVEQPTHDQRRGLPNVLVLKDAHGNQRLINPCLELPMAGAPDMMDGLDKVMGVGWEIIKAQVKNKIGKVIFNKDKKTLTLSDPSKLLHMELKHPKGKQQHFQVFSEDVHTGTIRHIGGNSDREADHNAAYFELVRQAMVHKEPLHALTFLQKIQQPVSAEIIGQVMGLEELFKNLPISASPDEKTVPLKAMLHFKESLSSIQEYENLGIDTGTSLSQIYQTLLKSYSAYLVNHNRVKADLQLTPEEHRFLLAIANKVSPKFAKQHGALIKDLIQIEELKFAEVEKLSKRLADIYFIDKPTTYQEKASKIFLELIVTPSSQAEKKEKWKQVRQEIQQAAVATQGADKDFFTTLDRFAEYAMESSTQIDEVLSSDSSDSDDLIAINPSNNDDKIKNLQENLVDYFTELKSEQTLSPIQVIEASSRSIEQDLTEATIDKKRLSEIQKLADYQAFCPSQEALLECVDKNAEMHKQVDKSFTVKKAPGTLSTEQKVLFLDKDKKTYFSESNPRSLEQTDKMIAKLEAICNSDDEPSSVKAAAKELLDSLELAKKSHKTTKLQEINQDQIQNLEDDLKAKKARFHKRAADQKAAIEESLIPPFVAERTDLLRKGKIESAVGFEDVMKAFLQDDFAALRKRLHPGINIDQLTEDMRQYLLDATMEQRVDRSLKNLKTYTETKQKDPEDSSGIAAAAAAYLYADLFGERQYDPNEHPEFMVFELKANILIRPNQLPILEALVQDPSSVKQAVTGIGKTSVILLLVALLKAKPGQLSMLYFPRELFEDNTEHLQTKLGAFFERNVYELRYPPSAEQLKSLGLPADQILHSPWEIDEDTKAQHDFMIFRGIYQQLIRTTTDRGVVTSTKEAALGLQSQYKVLLKKMAENPDVMTQMDYANIVQVSKVLMFLRQHGVQLTDEVDRICDVRDKFLRAKTSENKIAQFKSDAVLEVYQTLLEVESAAEDADKVHILENGQQDIKPEVRKKAIVKTAELLVQKFEKDGLKAEKDIILNYLLGNSGADKALIDSNQFKLWPPEKKDALKIMQEEITTILSITLSAKGGLKYGQSTNPKKIHEVVPYRLGMARNNARQGLDLEVLSYTTQHYYQKGAPAPMLESWISGYIEAAKREVVVYTEVGTAPDLNTLKAAKAFDEFFYGETGGEKHLRLSQFLQDGGEKAFVEEFRKLRLDHLDRLNFIANFLKEKVYPELKACPSSTQDDASSFLSMHKHNSGASATIGGLMGIKALNTEKAKDPEAMGGMTLRLLENGEMNCRTYDPHDVETIKNVIADNADNEVFIDGAGLLAGLDGSAIASSFLEHLQKGKHSKIKGVVFWDDHGSKKVAMAGGKITTVQGSGLQKHELGMYCDYARSRGADQPLGARAVGTVTVNEVIDHDGLTQAGGRMRELKLGEKLQKVVFNVPQDTGMGTKIEVIEASIRKKAQLGEENLVRRITAEMRNEVHDAMMERLLLVSSTLLDGADLDSDLDLVKNRFGILVDLYQNYAKHEILDTAEEKEMKEGEYFEKNKMLNHKANTMQVLEKLRKGYQKVAEECNLSDSTEQGALWKSILSRDITPLKKFLKVEIEIPTLNDLNMLVEVARVTNKPLNPNVIALAVLQALFNGESINPQVLAGVEKQTGIPVDMLQMIQSNKLIPESAQKLVSRLPDAVNGLNAFKEEWKTAEWKETIGARLPDEYLTGADATEQAQEMEQEQEQEMEQQQELEMVKLEVKEVKEVKMTYPSTISHPWQPWKEKESSLKTLLAKTSSVARFKAEKSVIYDNYWGTKEESVKVPDIWKLDKVGKGTVVKGFFKDVLVNNNVLLHPDKVFPTGSYSNPVQRKLVQAVLVTKDKNGDVKVLGLDALDRNKVAELLTLDREKDSDDSAEQAYLYDLQRRRVIATGKNDKDIPVVGTPEEILDAVLKLRILNLELDFEKKELERIEKMFRKSFPFPNKFLEFKDYFENGLLPLRQNSHVDYAVGNLKELMDKLELEAEEIKKLNPDQYTQQSTDQNMLFDLDSSSSDDDNLFY